MRKLPVLLVLLLILATLAFPKRGVISSQAVAGANVVINEFRPNPLSGPQWVELLNPTNNAYDVSSWEITTQSQQEKEERELRPNRQSEPAAPAEAFTLPAGASIAPMGYFVVNLPAPIIDPAGDSVILFDNIGTEIDRTSFLSKPLKGDMAWARFPNGIDTDSIDDWRLQTTTRGASNSAPPVTPTIICTLSSFQVEIGSSITVRVLIGPPRSALVTIQMRRAGDLDWSNLTTAVTEASGVYAYPWLPPTIGPFNFRAYVYPSNSFPESYSLPVSLLATKIRIQVSCFVTRAKVSSGQYLATYGYIVPALGNVNVTLTYRKPTGAPMVRYMLTDGGGLYNDTAFAPQEVGSWNVTASWDGDDTHASTSSPLARFSVEQPPSPPFGMWLVVAMVVSVIVSAVVLAAGLSSKAVQKPPRRVALCPRCRSVLLYVPSIRGWYCPRCRRHMG